MNDSKNINDRAPLIPGHEYDGILELDNPLPGWWLFTFFGTIIFAFLYWIHYSFSGAPNSAEELKVALEEIKNSTASAAGSQNVATMPTLLTNDQLQGFAKQPDTVKLGRAVFTAKCASCHGPEAGGLVGPNLTDHFWIHGKGTGLDILAVVSEGVLDKGMPAWKDLLKPDELKSVLGYILSIQNTNISGGKAPQGTEIK